MTPEKILEIARRYTVPDVRDQQVFYDDGSPSRTLYSITYWEFCEEELLSFAQSIIEAARESSYEPVAWLCKDGIRFNCEVEPKAGEPELPLYRHPPPELKLTDEAHELFASIERRINGEEE